jgi:hypothetical protein
MILDLVVDTSVLGTGIFDTLLWELPLSVFPFNDFFLVKELFLFLQTIVYCSTIRP